MQIRWIAEKWDYGEFRLQVRKTQKSKWENVPTEGPLPPKIHKWVPQEVRTPKCECGHRKKWHEEKTCNAPLPDKRVCACKGFKLKASGTPVKKETQKKYSNPGAIKKINKIFN